MTAPLVVKWRYWNNSKSRAERSDNVRLISDAEYFTIPAQELCMDCIRYLCYMERKVPS